MAEGRANSSEERVKSPATQIDIRRAAPDDAPAIAALLQQSFVEFKALYTDGGFAATALGAAQILARMREGPVWVALRLGVLLGTVAAVVKAESAYIRGMAVLPPARGSGTGGALLQHVEDWAVSQGCARLALAPLHFLVRPSVCMKDSASGARTMAHKSYLGRFFSR